jgi:hypothetical protein
MNQTKGLRAAAAYKKASRVAYSSVSAIKTKGSMLGTFMLLYCILTLYWSFLLYRDVRSDGCEPACEMDSAGVFDAMLGT